MEFEQCAGRLQPVAGSRFYFEVVDDEDFDLEVFVAEGESPDEPRTPPPGPERSTKRVEHIFARHHDYTIDGAPVFGEHLREALRSRGFTSDAVGLALRLQAGEVVSLPRDGAPPAVVTRLW